MKRVFITGSADGLGYAAADQLQRDGHEVVVHVRSSARASAVHALVARGATCLVGDLAQLDETCRLADQANALGPMDAVIHNAGVYQDPRVLPINVVAPYVLTAMMLRAPRLIYLSSGLHRSGRGDPSRLARLDWTGTRPTASYDDSKLFVTALAFAIARRWPGVSSHAVDPGWVPTKMGGANAPDDLSLGHTTQTWLAVSDDDDARTSAGYWFHQARTEAHPAARDATFQDALVEALTHATGITLSGSSTGCP
jgi:NAD(P)-dependent dehydrogenase (short-subunit alcohol dehydrogenase family)